MKTEFDYVKGLFRRRKRLYSYGNGRYVEVFKAFSPLEAAEMKWRGEGSHRNYDVQSLSAQFVDWGEVKVVFFSHSLTSYSSPEERECVFYLRDKYRGCELLDPSRLRLPDDFDKAMKVVLPLVRKCDVLAYYKDGSYSPGVDCEVLEAHKHGVVVVHLEVITGEVAGVVE